MDDNHLIHEVSENKLKSSDIPTPAVLEGVPIKNLRPDVAKQCLELPPKEGIVL